MANYKYTTTFEFQVKASDDLQNAVLAKANLENLKPLIPNEVDLEKNIDLMGVAFNAAVVNEFNKNGDGISTKTARESLDQFKHKPTNIEHDRNKIVGHIVNAGFSDRETNELLDDVPESETKPFNIALGAVVYKTANRKFFESLKDSTDPENKMHGMISASWEVGFSEYNIAVGSKSLKDAEVISDPDQISKMKGMLRGFGGKGIDEEGKEIYRLITGKVYPLGIGFTMKPAANVKGVIGDQETKEVKEKSKASDRLEKISSEISQNLKKIVNNNKIMDLEKLLSELKDSLVEKKFSEEAVASMTSTFADAIKQKDEEYKASLEAKETHEAEIVKANEDLKASVDGLKSDLETAQEKINEFEAAKKQEEAVARFNARMEEVDSLYNLEESDATFIAEKIKNLDESEEAYASFKSELEVFWASKSKANIEKIEAEIQARIDAEVEKRISNTSEASEESDSEDSVEDALDQAEVNEASVPNNNDVVATEPQSLREKFAKAFSRDNILS